MKRNEIIVHEHKKGVRAVKYNQKPQTHIEPPKTRNPVAKNASAAVGGGAAGAHKDAKKASQAVRGQKHKNAEMAEGYRDRRDSYQRDYDSSVSGMGNDYKRDFKRREMEHELGHETNNYAVAIDGRTWKVFASKNHAQAVARSLQNKGKNATVHETGAEPTAEAMGADMGKITKVDPATKKATLTKPDGSSMEVDSTALKPTPDGKMTMDVPDTDELKMGTNVVSTEEDMMAPPTDSSSPIPGDNDHDEISKLLVHRLKRLAGL